MAQIWDELLFPRMEETAWELFHENSKTERFGSPPANEAVRKRMAELWTSLPYEGYRAFALPPPLALDQGLSDVIRRRVTGRDMRSCRLSLPQLSTLLFHAYGETRSNRDTQFPRPFRVVPSGGALYPLELYFHSARVDGLPAGIYHYNPSTNELRLIQDGDFSHRLCNALIQPNIPLDSSLQVFVTAFFERSTFKYAERGYRFVLIEAGHVAQNMNLVATAMGLAIVNIGGYFDREIDALLGLDGIARSTIYAMAVGARGDRQGEDVW